MRGVGPSRFLEESVDLPRFATVSKQPCLKALFLTEVAWTFFPGGNTEESLPFQRILKNFQVCKEHPQCYGNSDFQLNSHRTSWSSETCFQIAHGREQSIGSLSLSLFFKELSNIRNFKKKLYRILKMKSEISVQWKCLE